MGRFFKGNIALPTVFEDSLSWYEFLGKLFGLVNETNENAKKSIERADAAVARANVAIERAEEIIASTDEISYDSSSMSIIITGFERSDNNA